MDIFTGLFDAGSLLGQELSEDSLRLFVETVRDKLVEKLAAGEEVFVFNAEVPLEQVVAEQVDSVIGFGVFGDGAFNSDGSGIYNFSFDDIAGVVAVGVGGELPPGFGGLPPGFGGLPPGFGDSPEFDLLAQIDDLLAQAGSSLTSGFVVPIKIDFSDFGGNLAASDFSGNLVAVVGGGLPPGFSSPV